MIAYQYDDNGNLTALTPPGRPAHGFAYTAVDLEREYTPPAVPLISDPRTTRTYNLDRQLETITRPDNQTVAFGYDAAGRLGTVTLQPLGETRTSAYHPATGQLATLSAPDAALGFTYDGPLLRNETWTFSSPSLSHAVDHSYDADLRLESLQVDTLPAVTFDYDDDGLLTQAGDLSLTRAAATGLLLSAALPGTVPVTDTWTPSPLGEVDGYSADVGGTPNYSFAVTARDQLGRIVEKTETIEGVTTSYTYGYDPAGRLADVWRTSAPAAQLAHYEYDPNGNRIGGFTAVSGSILAASYDAQDRLESYETTLGGATTYTYTANGELETKTDASGTTTYTYDALGDLRAVTLPGGTEIEDLVDGRNRRIGKKVNGVFVQGFLYRDQLRPVAELGSTGAVVAQFVYGSKPNVPDYMIKNGTTYRIISDHLGSPRLVVNLADGLVAQRLDYDEFGNVVADSSPGFQPFGFAGGIYDPDTALVRFGARDYNPQTSRWTAKDPVGFTAGDTNLYVYVVNDPVNGIDSTGLTGTVTIPFPGTGGIAIPLPGPGAGLGLGIGLGIGVFLTPSQCGEPPEQEREQLCDHQYYSVDIPVCRAIGAARGSEAARRCYASAAERYAACLAGRSLPPLDTWNN